MTVSVRGADEVGAKLAGVSARLRDLTPQTTVIAADVMTLVDDSFAGGRAPDGSTWAPLAESTLRQRRGTTTLVDTGALRSSISARATRTGLMFGTNIPYGRPHQTGGRRLPQRAFLPVDISGTGWSLTERGPAGDFWRRAREAIANFVRTGEVT